MTPTILPPTNRTNTKKWALIPARGGSKRIPRKNIVDFLGRPLIWYSIEAAKKSGLFDEVVVSTEDEEIAAICRPYCTVIKRSAELASDAATLKDVCLDIIAKNPGQFDILCLMEADCPLRDGDDLKKSWEQFSQKKCSMLMSVFRYGTFYPFWALSNKDEEGNLKEGYQFFFNRKYLTKSQLLPDVFCPSGAFKWIDCQAFQKSRTLYPDDLDVMVLDWMKALDMDTVDDLLLGKMIKTFLDEHPRFFEVEKGKFLERSAKA